jgi:hypothetical protein
MSVSHSIMALPPFGRPPGKYKGNGKRVTIFWLELGEQAGDLRPRPKPADPENQSLVEPILESSFDEYRTNIRRTRPQWNKHED